ncbi:MAG: PilZ domain-containing protein, partial [Candidatus Sulfotelmatobacter sp.]
MLTERRSCLRHKVHGPVFASFDGVTGGMILDLSEQGLSMQTMVPMDANRRLQFRLDLPDSGALETTGYIAWADALGRAGVRFSDLPEDARLRLDQWLALHDEAPSHKAPKLTFDQMPASSRASALAGSELGKPRSVTLEADAGTENVGAQAAGSATMQYEFHSLGSDLNTALRVISERARTLLRG